MTRITRTTRTRTAKTLNTMQIPGLIRAKNNRETPHSQLSKSGGRNQGLGHRLTMAGTIVAEAAPRFPRFAGVGTTDQSSACMLSRPPVVARGSESAPVAPGATFRRILRESRPERSRRAGLRVERNPAVTSKLVPSTKPARSWSRP
jgi:hypothetical protein